MSTEEVVKSYYESQNQKKINGKIFGLIMQYFPMHLKLFSQKVRKLSYNHSHLS